MATNLKSRPRMATRVCRLRRTLSLSMTTANAGSVSHTTIGCGCGCGSKREPPSPSSALFFSPCKCTRHPAHLTIRIL
ncbi:hypothetical protein PENSPDRAFT_149558 [Peniophora sp. CONT]|nr:hypothetical protein PENSPDRAFT_149558 [Peniophora sp. CONT]